MPHDANNAWSPKLEALQVAAAVPRIAVPAAALDHSVIQHLKACRGPQRAGDIAAALGGPRTTISGALGRLVAEGTVRRQSRGMYELVDG